jgi:hypothetical protein
MLLSSDEQDFHSMLSVDNTSKENVRIMFFFFVADFSTDGKWCFVVLWVVPRVRRPVQWSLLKRRIEEVCPSIETQFAPPLIPPVSSRKVLLLQVCSSDRTGLLNGR